MVTAQRHPYWVLKDKASLLPSFCLALSLNQTHTHTYTHAPLRGQLSQINTSPHLKNKIQRMAFQGLHFSRALDLGLFFCVFFFQHKTPNLQSAEFIFYFLPGPKLLLNFQSLFSIIFFNWVDRSVQLYLDPGNTLRLCVIGWYFSFYFYLLCCFFHLLFLFKRVKGSDCIQHPPSLSHPVADHSSGQSPLRSPGASNPITGLALGCQPCWLAWGQMGGGEFGTLTIVTG